MPQASNRFARRFRFELPFPDLGNGEVDIRPRYADMSTGTFIRATTAMTMLSTGWLGQVASGVPRSWYDPSAFRTNVALHSQAFDNAFWSKQLNGTGSAPVVAADVGVAPDGTVTAERAQFALNGGTTTNDRSIIGAGSIAAAEPGNGVDGVTRTFSVWMKSNDNNNYLIQTRMNGLSQLNVITPQWQRFSTTSNATNGDGTIWFGLRGAMGTSDSADILVWGAQVERSAVATDYIQTTSAIRSVPTAACDGYLPEGPRTNLCLQSANLGTTWANFRSTETLNAVVAPDGTLTADKLVEDATAANTHGIQQLNINIVNAVHTVSVFVKAGERRWCYIDINDGVNFPGANFNLQDGTVGTTFNSVASIQSFPNGWYRCVVTSTMALTATAVGSVDIFLSTGDGGTAYNGDGVSGAYFWGAQLEAAAMASSYIPTTTATVTRNGDVLRYAVPAGVMFSGTLFVDCHDLHGNVSGVGNRYTFLMDDGDTSDDIGFLLGQSQNTAQVRSNSVGTVALGLGTSSAGQRIKVAMGYNASAPRYVASKNGAAVVSASSGAFPLNLTHFAVGNDGTGQQPFSPIRSVAYLGRLASDAEIKRLARTV